MTDSSANIDLSKIAELYTKSLEAHGAKARGVGWGESAAHEQRFEKLTSVISSPEDQVTVNDLGCGYGALLDYLDEKGFQVTRYRGYDISVAMLEEARQRLDPGRVELSGHPVLDREADYSFASGIFNVKMEEDEASWEKHVFQTLDNMSEHSLRGFAFNLLSTYVDYREEHLYYGDPLRFFDHCKRSYSPYVSLLHDYPLYEWTIAIRL